MSNSEFIQFVLENTDKPWDLVKLCANKNVTFEDKEVLEQHGLWSWTGFSSNPSVTLENLITNTDKPWIWKDICASSAYVQDMSKINPNILESFLDIISRNKVTEIDSSSNLSYSGLSWNPKLTLDFIVRNIDENWSWIGISCTAPLTIPFMIKYEDKLDWICVSHNPNLKLEHVLAFLESKPWNWSYLSRILDVNLETVLQYSHIPWDFKEFCANKTLMLNDVIQNPNLPWDYSTLSSNPNISIDFVRETVNKHPWNWSYLSMNPGISMHDIDDNPELPWKFSFVSKNPKLTLDFIKKHMDKTLNWKDISSINLL